MTSKTGVPYAQFGERGTELVRRISAHSLSTQLLAGAILSVIAAFLSFMLFFTAGSFLLDVTVYGKDFAGKVEDRKFRSLQEYVIKEKITKEGIYRLTAWSARSRSLYFTVYEDGALVYETPVGRIKTRGEFDPDMEDPYNEYTLELSDGTELQAFLYYLPRDSFYLWMMIVAGVLAFLVFSTCFVSLVHRKVRYIKKLKGQLDVLAGGQLEYPVTIKGKDELAELASGIDEMRRSILSHQRAEENIRSANSRLVTAMSHDLRTPLTSLLAYLELLDRGKYTDEEQMKHLIRQSLTKTVSIKTMAEKLFEYSLVYTSEWEETDSEAVDADELFQQVWHEYAFSLESRGFAVEKDFGTLNGTVNVNADLLRRAFDNIYSNLMKYADPAGEIKLKYLRRGNEVAMTIINSISADRDEKESTNIGLNTCKRIMRIHAGSFEAGEDGGKYKVEFVLPLLPFEDPGDERGAWSP